MALITKEEELKFLDYKNPEQTITKEEYEAYLLHIPAKRLYDYFQFCYIVMPNRSFYSYCRGLAPFVLLSMVPFGIVCHLIYAIQKRLMEQVLEDVLNLFMWINCYAIMMISLIYQKYLKATVFGLGDSRKFSFPPTYFQISDRYNKATLIVYVYVLVMVVCYLSTKYLQAPACREYNEKNGIEGICELCFATRLPFKHDYTPMKQIIYVYQFLAINYFALALAMSTVGFMCLIHNISLRLRHIKDLVNEINNFDKDKVMVDKQLIFCIEYHAHITKINDTFNTLSSTQALVVLILAGISIALGCIGIMFFFNIRVVFVTLGYVIAVGMSCLTSQWVLDEEEDLYDEFCNLKWYEMSENSKFLIKMMILKLQKPLRMKVGPTMYLSLEYFLDRVRETFSYVTLVHSFVDIED